MQTDHVIHSISLISIIPNNGEKSPASGRMWSLFVNFTQLKCEFKDKFWNPSIHYFKLCRLKRAWISRVNEGGDHGNAGALVVLSKRLKMICTVKNIKGDFDCSQQAAVHQMSSSQVRTRRLSMRLSRFPQTDITNQI